MSAKWSLWTMRLALIALGLGAWFWTQSLIGRREFPASGIGDGLHAVSAPAHQYLLDHPKAANGLLIVSSAFIDLFGIFLLATSVFGPTLRPFLGLFLLFGLRQMCQAVCALPPPETMIWHDPGFPSLLVTYGVANDLFFSGHTAIAVFGAMEVSRIGQRWLTSAAIAVAVFEVVTVLILRAHYTMDVFAGAVVALLVGTISVRLAPQIDQWFLRFARRFFHSDAGSPP
jgi:hypothetical protein